MEKRNRRTYSGAIKSKGTGKPKRINIFHEGSPLYLCLLGGGRDSRTTKEEKLYPTLHRVRDFTKVFFVREESMQLPEILRAQPWDCW